MDKSENYITEEKRKSLEADLLELKGPKRKEILESLEYAKSLGDLSENAEYHQAREDQVKLEEKILHIEQILRSAKVVSLKGGDLVGIGSKVIVKKENEKEERTYQVVGSQEPDMAEGKISNKSPFGQAIFGKKKGDTFSFKTPSGEASYKIVDVS